MLQTPSPLLIGSHIPLLPNIKIRKSVLPTPEHTALRAKKRVGWAYGATSFSSTVFV